MSAPLSIHHLFCGLCGSFGLLLAWLREPTHHAAQLSAHDFDGMLLLFFAQLVEIGAAGFVLSDPLFREATGLDVGENLLHGLASFIAHDSLTASEVAILRGVGNGVAHALQTTF